MYSSNHSTLFYLILARTLGGQNSYRGKSVSLGRFMSTTNDCTEVDTAKEGKCICTI